MPAPLESCNETTTQNVRDCARIKEEYVTHRRCDTVTRGWRTSRVTLTGKGPQEHRSLPWCFDCVGFFSEGTAQGAMSIMTSLGMNTVWSAGQTHAIDLRSLGINDNVEDDSAHHVSHLYQFTPKPWGTVHPWVVSPLGCS